MAKKQKKEIITPIEFVEGEPIHPVKFYAERATVNVKNKPKTNETEYFIGLVTDNPEVLKIGRDGGDVIYEVTIRATE